MRLTLLLQLLDLVPGNYGRVVIAQGLAFLIGDIAVLAEHGIDLLEGCLFYAGNILEAISFQ